jgi:N-acetylglucosaminyldiphosphoundecaprenol N-acetyl-beta-D-mannosaminyltransferase
MYASVCACEIINIDRIGVDFVMVVGGTFDVVAGKVSRVPLWMQNYGIERLYRVFQEPGCIWKRYLVTNTIFLLMLLNALAYRNIRPNSNQRMLDLFSRNF